MQPWRMAIYMKKTQVRELFRTITASPFLFWSLVVIVALSAASFCGIAFCIEGLNRTADSYYREHNFYDIQVSSYAGFTPEEINALSETPGVTAAESSIETQQYILSDGQRLAAKLYTQPGGINLPDIIEGRLPEKAGECSIETALADRLGLSVGDTLQLETKDDSLLYSSYSIVGTVELPQVMYISNYDYRGSSSLGDGQIASFIIVSEDSFAEQNRNTVWIQTDFRSQGQIMMLSDEYDDYVAKVKESVKAVGEEYTESQCGDIERSIEEAKAELEIKKEEYDQGLTELEDAKEQLASMVGNNSAYIVTDDMQAQINEYKSSISQAEKELDEAQTLIESVQNSIAIAEKKYEYIKTNGYVVLDVNSNPSYVDFSMNRDSMYGVLWTCSLLFLFTGTLVCFTTVGRMVSERRNTIGIQKALGFRDSEIYKKYILYSLIAVLIGLTAGIFIAYFFVQRIVFYVGYEAAFLCRDYKYAFLPLPVAFISVAELAVMGLSAYFSCRSLVKTEATVLMRSSVESDSGTNGYFRARFNRLSLRVRMPLRGMFSNRKIFLTTLTGICSCSVLLITVITVYYSMEGVADKQYEELQTYDSIIAADPLGDIAERAELEEYLYSFPVTQVLKLCKSQVSFKVGQEYRMASMMVFEESDLSPLINLYDIDTGERMIVPEEGALISRKAAELSDYKVGDMMELTDSYGQTCYIRIAGIFEWYIGHAVILSPGYYYTVTGLYPDYTQYYTKLFTDNEEEFLSEIKHNAAFASVTDAGIYRAKVAQRVGMVVSAIWIVLVMALILTVFVLFNLAVMNLDEKKKELIIMGTMGFSDTQRRKFALGDIMAISAAGLVVGLLIGTPVGAMISRSIEISQFQNIRSISIPAAAIGTGICLLFTLCANYASLRSLRRISLTERVG